MPYTNEVIKYFRRKTASGFNEPISWLGSEQRFVGPLRNSNVNNLEEQYVLGTDTYTVSYEDSNGNEIIEKSFCVAGEDLTNATNYYKIITTIYKNPHIDSDIYFSGNDLDISNKYNDLIFGEAETSYPDTDALYFLDSNRYSFNQNGEVEMTSYTGGSSSEFGRTRRDELYFVKSGSPDLLVLTKITEVKYLDGGNKKVIREKIVNALDPSKH